MPQNENVLARELIMAQAEYIKLLSEECSELTQIWAARQSSFDRNGIKRQRADAGAECRKRIETAMIALRQTKCLYIIRGLPGSGKSTLARSLAPKSQICSTDDFFITKNGAYKFNPKYLLRAHEWNKLRTQALMSNGTTPIVVDNTNTQAWEYKAYIDLAKLFGYNIEVRIPDTPWAFNVDECTKRTIHGVPREAIQRMADRFENDLYDDTQ